MSESLAHALSGAAGGIISMAATYPLIVQGTREQIAVNTTNTAISDKRSKSWKDYYSTTSKNSGISSALFGVALSNGVYYYYYELFRSNAYAQSVVSSPTAQGLLAGSLAGAATAIITNPVWVVNTRLATNKKSLQNAKNQNTIQYAMQLFKDEGIAVFFSGIVPALILVANPAIQYMVFEKLLGYLKLRREPKHLDFLWLGALSKLVATSITYPYLTVKSRHQTGGAQLPPLDALREIIAKEGVQGLYKGITAKLSQSVLTAAILFFAKESLFSYTVKLLALGSIAKTR